MRWVRRFYESLLDMESGPDGSCYNDIGSAAVHDGADGEFDFSFIGFPCQPWSSLANRADRPNPECHALWNAVFGAEGSSVSIAKIRHPFVLLFENVYGFAKLKDFSGRTGLQRLVDEIKSVKVNGRQWYTGWRCCRVCTDSWGGASKPRCPETKPER